jgi:hypothetical protein
MLDDALRTLVAGLQDAPSSPSNPQIPALAALTASPGGNDLPASSPAPQHKGLFGIHGTLRDIIGGLGDAFLVQSGNKPLYSIQRQQEKEGDAMRDFVSNPLAAVQRLAQENPELAAKIYDDYQQTSRVGRDADEKYTGTVTDRALRLLAAANKDNYPQIKDQITRYLGARGVTLPFDLPDAYDEQAISGIRQAAVPVNQQIDDSAIADYRQRTGDLTESRLRALEDYRKRNLDERGRYHRGVLRLGNGRLEEDTRHHGITERQGDARVKQGDSVIHQYERGVRGRQRRAAPGGASPIIDPNDKAAYSKLPSGTTYRLPNDPTIYRKK